MVNGTQLRTGDGRTGNQTLTVTEERRRRTSALYRRYILALLTVFAGMASFLGVAYIAADLLMGSDWVKDKSLYLLTHGFYWFLMSFLLCLLFLSEGGGKFLSPKVLKVLDGDVLLLSRSDWIGYQTMVAVYSVEDDVERLIAHGGVQNIQSNGLIQIKIETLNEGVNVDNLSGIKSNLIIRPGVVV